MVVALVVYAFAFQGARGLWEPDEGRYTAVALEMQRLGDYLSPRLHHEVEHLSKPPLTYWLLAGSFAVFGREEWAARLPNTLAFLATVLLVALLARRLADGSRLAPLVYATSLLPFVAANVVTTDTLLTLFETLAVWGFVELWWGPERRRALFRLVAWAGFGLAFLTKGPPGLLPLLAIVVFAARTEGRNGLRKLVSPAALLAFCGLGLTWYIALAVREPGVLEHLLRVELYDRIFTAANDRNAAWYGPVLVYVPAFLVGTLPWTGSVLAALRDAWRSLVRRRGDAGVRDQVETFLLLWLLVPLAVFVVARSRLHFYVLPLFVPLALLAARQVGTGNALPRRWRAWLAVWVLGLVALRVAGGLAPHSKDSRLLARAISASIREPIYEIVFFNSSPRYGLVFYLDAEVETATLGIAPHPSWRAEPLDDELREDEGLRVFVVPRRHLGTFRAAAPRLGFTPVLQGGWRDLSFFLLQRAPASASLTEGHARQLCFETTLLFRIVGARQPVRQLEEVPPLLLARFQARLDQLDQDPVGARAARLCQRLDAAGDARGKAHSLTDGFFDG